MADKNPLTGSQNPLQKPRTTPPQPPLDDLLAAIEEQVRENPALRAVDTAVDNYRNALGPIRANLEELNSENITSERKTSLVKDLSEQLQLLRDRQLMVEDEIQKGKVSPDQLLPNKLKELVKLSETIATMKRNTDGLERAIINSSKK